MKNGQVIYDQFLLLQKYLQLCFQKSSLSAKRSPVQIVVLHFTKQLPLCFSLVLLKGEGEGVRKEESPATVSAVMSRAELL